jgi:hypothetical protein
MEKSGYYLRFFLAFSKILYLDNGYVLKTKSKGANTREASMWKKQIFFVGLMVSILAMGCGGKEKTRTAQLVENEQDVDLYAHLTGIDDSTKVQVEADETEQPANANTMKQELGAEKDENYIGGSQGAFHPTLTLNGKEAKGSYTVRRADNTGEVVKENLPANREVRLDPGRYDMVFTTPKIVGSPEFTLRDVEIEAGRRLKQEVRIPVGEITLVTGARCQTKPVKIRLKGASDWYPGKFYTCKPLTLMAGEYDAEMKQGRATIPISGIQVYDGGIRNVPIYRK